MGAMVNNIIGAVIALLPLYTKIGERDMTRVSKDNLLVIIMALICFFLPKKERQLSKVGYASLAYCIIMLFVNQWNPVSFSVQMQTFYISIGLIFFACFYEKHSKLKSNSILNGMAIGCIIQSLITIISYFNIPVYFTLVSLFNDNIVPVNTVPVGIGSLGQSNLLAAYVAITSIALFRKGWAVFLPLSLVTLILADSMMGYATLLAGSLYFINSSLGIVKKHWAYVGASLAMIGAYFVGVNGMDTERFYSWSVIIERMDLTHFLFGKGPGWFYDHAILNGPIAGQLMIQEHNEFLSALNIFGFVGFLIALPMIFKFLKRDDKSVIFPSILFASFVNSYGHFSLHQSTTALMIIVAAAFCLSEGEEYVINLER